MISYLYNALYNSMFAHANEIVPGLWLADYTVALDSKFIESNNIGVVVNCTPTKPFIQEQVTSNLDIIRLPVYDSQLQRDILLMEHYFNIAIPYIQKQYFTEGKNIIVHCVAGKQRSAILVAAVLYDSINKGHTSFRTMNINRILGDSCVNLKSTSSRRVLEKAVFSHIVKQRPQAFTYGYKINFIGAFRRYFRL